MVYIPGYYMHVLYVLHWICHSLSRTRGRRADNTSISGAGFIAVCVGQIDIGGCPCTLPTNEVSHISGCVGVIVDMPRAVE